MKEDRFLNEKETNFLKSLIMKNGMGIESVAKRMNMSRATLSSRINGKTDFSRKEWKHLLES